MSRPLRLFLGLVLLHQALFFGLRLVFWLVFRHTSSPLGLAETARALYLGAKFDLRLAIVLAALVVLLSFSWSCADRLRAHERTLFRGLFAALGLCWSAIYIVDLGHYGYLGRRLDAGLTEHLLAPDIALRMVWQSYPVLPALAAWAAGLGLYAALGARWSLKLRRAPPKASGRGRRLVSASVLVLLSALGLWGKASAYPLRWSDAYFSPEPFAAALALNPCEQLIDTWHYRRAGYDRAAVERHYPQVAAALGVSAPDPVRLSFTRRTQVARPLNDGGPPNIVVIFIESFAAFKVGALGNPAQGTPHFDALAHQGLLFTHFFVATSPTARSIFSTISGLPDVSPEGSSSRNPLAVRQDLLANRFEGYDKLYLLGGSANWGNIRGFLRHNIGGLQIVEEGDFSSPRNDVWGVSDRNLLAEAHRRFEARARPFLAFVQLAGNHRPYTIPADDQEFQRQPRDPELLRRAGFDDGQAEFDALRYIDHSLGDYFRRARVAAYFPRTIYFLLGDHGTTAPPGTRWQILDLNRNHVPLLIYAPALLPGPRVIETVASSLDVMPTAAALAGVEADYDGFGRDLLAERLPAPPLAFIRAVPRMGLLDDGYFLRLEVDGGASLFRYREAREGQDVGAQEPEVRQRMRALCEGLHETARFLLLRGSEGR